MDHRLDGCIGRSSKLVALIMQGAPAGLSMMQLHHMSIEDCLIDVNRGARAVAARVDGLPELGIARMIQLHHIQ